MKILFATTNPAKINYYAKELEKRGIEVLTLKDLDLEIEINENGKDAIENAIIKAKAYYEETKMITIALDDNLYIDGLPEKEQPGTEVRRVNGKRLSDEEMIEYYSNIVNKLGGKAEAKWVKGVAICNEKEVKTFSYSRSSFYFVDKPSKKVTQGYPLDSLAIIPEFNKYLSELSEEESKKYKNKSANKEIFDFITNNI